MKSNQERSKECLPPKKREIPSSTLPSDRHSSPTMAPPSDVHRSDSLPWLTGGNSEGVNRSTSQSEYKPLSSSIDSFPSSSSVRPVSSLPALYTSAQSTAGGTLHYTQLPPNLQFITSPYPTSYPGYIPSQIFSPPPPPPQRPSHTERPSHTHTETIHTKPERPSNTRTSMPPPSTDSIAPHHLHHRTAPAHHQGTAHHAPHSLHSQHALGHGMSQVLLQYADGPLRKDDGGSRTRELHNGELERGRRFEPKSGKLRDSYEARSRVLSSDYATHDPSGLRISSMLMPNSHSDHSMPRASPDKHSSSHMERGSIVSGKPVRTPSSSSSTSTFTFPAPPPPSVDSPKPTQTVIQTTHSSTEPLSLGLPFPQQPIIGYIAGAQHCLPQHLLIPGPQPVIIPVSGAVTSLDTSQVVASSQAAPFSSKADPLASPAGLYQTAAGAVVQGQLHLPIIPASPSLVTSGPPPAVSSSNSALPHALPPYFIKGSIIQLADGELKRVEDLKTEDFIQSAEISSELKIDSSTVERIEGSRTSPNLAVVQFAVGEHRAQVNVEVLVEYPFFVFGQGWSSCCPDRTTQLLELPCTKLSVGDVCISLTLKNVKNGSLKKPIELATLPLKPTNHRSGQKENGINQRGSSGNVENGEVSFGERQGQGEDGSRRQSSGRKRRWSAPEGRKVERSEEEPPVTLPKPNFIPHEVKISIEGRSNIGK